MTPPQMASRVALALALVASLLVAGIACAQPSLLETSTTTALPDDDPRSGRFINLTRGLSSLGESGTHLSLMVPAAQTAFTLELFDGDMGGKWDPRSGGSSVPDVVRYTLYADPEASNARSVVVAQWFSSEMPDDGWWSSSVPQAPAGLGSDGNYRYNLVVEWVTTNVTNEQNNFKIRVEGLVYLLANSTYGFIGYGPNDPNPAIYPATSYDGTWRFMVDVPSDARTLDFWDGDFDRAADTNDPLSPARPPFTAAPTTVDEAARAGAPADDAVTGSPLRLSPSIRVVVTAPDDLWSVAKDDPSGNQEWELFRVSSDASDTTAHAIVDNIPAGLYEWRVEGADGRNTLFITPRRDLYPELCSIGDRVWNDADCDGVQDDGETGVPGVPVSLFRNGDTVAADTTVTGADGTYRFDHLAPGTYRLQFGLPQGWARSTPDQGGDDLADSDASVADGNTAPTELSPNEDDLSWDAGIYRLATIGDYVWYDADLDGVQDTEETGVEGATVTLYRADGTQAAQTATDAAGWYLFADLVPGQYYVVFGTLPGYAFTSQDQGDEASDSDAAPADGRTAAFDLTSGEEDLTWDAGLVRLGSIGDLVWSDTNYNGTQDAGETGLAGVTVTLRTADDTQVATTTTDADGRYLFSDLLPGDYYVVFGDLPGYSFTQQDQGSDDSDSDADPASGKGAVLSLGPGEDDLTWDAGLVRLASLGDLVWNDTNRNGLQDAGEIGIGGVSVTLYGAGGDIVATTTTAGNGSYAFTGLMPGSYSIEFGGKTGYAYTTPDQGADEALDSDADVSTGRTATFTLAAGANDTTWDAGLYTWSDVDAAKTGAQLAGDCKTIGFWKANITKHLSSSAEQPSGTQVTKTQLGEWLRAVDAFHLMNVLDLGPGSASLTTLMANAKAILAYTGSDIIEKTKRQLLASELNALSGVFAMDDAASHLAFCRTVEDAIEADSTDLEPLHDLCDQINNLGNESGDSRASVGDTLIFTITVTADMGLPARYEVRDYLDSSLTFISADQGGAYAADGHYVSWTVDLPSGQSATELRLWVKINTLPAGDSDDNPGAGWSFSDWFTMDVWSCDGSDDGCGDDDPPSCTSKQLRNRVTWDNGDEPNLGAIGDVVWNDAAPNGVQDAAEPGVAGVLVTLHDAGGNTLDTTTTDAQGKYLFGGLQPGEYSVSFTAPAGWALVPPNQGSNDATDSDADPATGNTGIVTLAEGETDLTWDAGMVQLAGLGDRVWFDADGDGLQTAGEAGVSGVTVSLYRAEGALVASTSTDDTGSYLFTGLTPGDYYLIFGGKDGYQRAASDQGSDESTDSDANVADGRTVVTHLDAGETDTTWDAGLQTAPSGTIAVQKSGGKFYGGCLSPGFWKSNIDKHLGSSAEKPNGTQVTKTQLLSWLRAVDAYYHPDVIDLGSANASLTTLLTAAKSILAYGGSDPAFKLQRELLASELNLASVTYAMADTTAHAALVCGAEDALKAGSPDLGDLHDLLSAANVLGDGTTSSRLCVGDQVLFTLTVTSDLAADATVELRDYLDQALSFLGATGGGSYVGNGRYVQWSLGVPAGQGVTTTVQIWAKVTGTPGAAGQPAGDWVVSNAVSLKVYATTSCTPGQSSSADRCSTGVGTLYNEAHARITQSGSGGCITDVVWNDANADGCWDDDESGRAGVQVRLKTGRGATIASTTTDSRGRFSFRNLNPGDYIIQVIAPSGSVQTYDATPPLDDCSVVALASGRTYSGTGFGYMDAPEQLVTYSQADWGNSPRRTTAAALLATRFDDVYDGNLSIGGGKSLRFTGADAVRAFLPTSGRADSLQRSTTDPQDDCGAGVLAGEVLALQLNVDFSQAGVLPVGLAYVKVVGGTFAGWRVSELLDLANAVLGGDNSALPQGVSRRDLAAALAAVNAGSDGGGTW